MALIPILTNSAISSDCGTETFDDGTVYGAPELDRNEVAVIVTGVKKGLPSEADIPLVISSNDNDPLTDSIWYAISTWDGWQVFAMYIIPLYNPVTLYSVGQVVYSGNQIWKCLASVSGVLPGTNPTYWEAILITDAAVEAANNVDFDYLNFIITCRSAKCYAKAVAASTIEGCCGDCSAPELKQIYERIDVLLNGVYSLCNQTRYADAEEVVRNITHICEKSKCICS